MSKTLTPGQALDWMIANEGKILIDTQGYIWRRCGTEIGLSTTNEAESTWTVSEPKKLSDMMGRRFFLVAEEWQR
jgi:hypothetical protein